MRRLISAPCTCVWILLTACSSPALPAESTAPATVSIPTARIDPPPLPSQQTTLSATAVVEAPEKPGRSQYRLKVDLDHPSRRVHVEESLLYLNRSNLPLPDLLLVVEPARFPGVFQLQSIYWDPQSPVFAYHLEGPLLKLDFTRPLQPGETLELQFEFTLNLPYQASAFGYTSRQMNLADWYPIVPPYIEGQGWLTRRAHIFGEHQVYDLADYDVTIRTPDPDLVLAAPGNGKADRNGYHYQLEAARHFVWSASHEYLLLEQSLGQRSLQVFVFPDQRSAGESALESMAQAVPLFEELFGAYPRRTLVMIEADFYDGYEADGAFFLDKAYFNDPFRSPENLLTTLVAHETAHQWFYASLASDQANQPWLDEALCTYSELLFYQRVYPNSAGWWWQFRVQRLHPSGWVNASIYDFDKIQPYINAVYLRGATFLHDLRTLIGDQIFFEFLADYARRGRLSHVDSASFFRLLDMHTPLDYSYLLDIYFAPPSPSRPE